MNYVKTIKTYCVICNLLVSNCAICSKKNARIIKNEVKSRLLP